MSFRVPIHRKNFIRDGEREIVKKAFQVASHTFRLPNAEYRTLLGLRLRSDHRYEGTSLSVLTVIGRSR